MGGKCDEIHNVLEVVSPAPEPSCDIRKEGRGGEDTKTFSKTEQTKTKQNKKTKFQQEASTFKIIRFIVSSSTVALCSISNMFKH